MAEDDEYGFVATKALNAMSSNALKSLQACKNQLFDNMIDKDFEEGGDMIQRMNMKVITLVTIMHEIKEISILYRKSVLADCLSLPD